MILCCFYLFKYLENPGKNLENVSFHMYCNYFDILNLQSKVVSRHIGYSVMETFVSVTSLVSPSHWQLHGKFGLLMQSTIYIPKQMQTLSNFLVI